MSDSGYTPTTEDVPTREDVRWSYVVGEFERRGDRGPIHDRGRPFYEAFDSWLAAHDAEVAAKALTDYADEVHGDTSIRPEDRPVGWANRMRARAAALGTPEQEEER